MLFMRYALAALALCSVVLASIGDKSIQFQRCVYSCKRDTCRNNRPVPITSDTIVPADPLPWYLVLTGWTCSSNCEYHCMHRVTNMAQKRVRDIQEGARRAVYGEYEKLRKRHEVFEWQQAAAASGIELEYCDEEYAGPRCIPRLARPPPLPLPAILESQVHQIIEVALMQLPVIEKSTVQFYGKWPQLRVFGMQEPMSVVFSLLNLVVQLEAMLLTFGRGIPDKYPLKCVYIWHTWVATMAWLASAVFHTRDLKWTERWDYFSAAAVLLSGLFLSVTRLFRIALGTQLFRRMLGAFCSAWALHVIYLSLLPKFDYGYNMTVCLAVGVIHNLLWIAYALAPRVIERFACKEVDEPEGSIVPSTGSKQKGKLVLLVICMFAAPALELFDFPPLWRTLDAHALWHLVTVPLTLAWYQWLATDAKECVALSWWSSSHTTHPKHSAIPTGLESTVIADATELMEGSGAAEVRAAPQSLPPAAAGHGRFNELIDAVMQLGALSIQLLRTVQGMLIVSTPRADVTGHVP